MKLIHSLLLFSAFSAVSLCAAAAPEEPPAKSSASCEEKKEFPADMMKETDHTLQMKGMTIPYKASVGTLTIKDCKDEAKAQIFYVAYTRTDVTDMKKRPLTFCFNGGPGSCSVWLHMGAFGPKRVVCDTEGLPVQPFQTTDNQYSLLDVTDLVFIDPVATGYSRAAPGQDPKQFFGVKEDISSVGDFIRMYTTKNARWQSPKVLAGESYGTTRAAGLSSYLQNKYFMSLNGVILVSSVLDWQTINLADKYNGNDLPCVLSLPTFAAAAWYYKKADTKTTLEDFLGEVEQFAAHDYTLALMQGDKLQDKQRQDVLDKLVTYTGISRDYLDCSNLRLDILSFGKQLLKSEQKIIGRFDARLEGIDVAPCDSTPAYDPSLDMVAAGYTATFNDYVKSQLGWDKDMEYVILGDVSPWNYEPAINQYLNVASDLRDTMTQNSTMKVFVASGLFDLATPYFATEYTLDHMQLSPLLKGNLIRKFYPGGHMMYLNEPNLQTLKSDLTEFFGQINQSVK